MYFTSTGVPKSADPKGVGLLLLTTALQTHLLFVAAPHMSPRHRFLSLFPFLVSVICTIQPRRISHSLSMYINVPQLACVNKIVQKKKPLKRGQTGPRRAYDCDFFP